MICGIYKIANLRTGKFYIGSSNDIHQRWNEHRSQLRRKVHDNKKLTNAWHKYGEDAFLFEVIEEVIIDNLLDTEQRYLDTLRPHNRKVGYNLVPIAGGGNYFQFLSEDDKKQMREKCSIASTGENNGMYGKNHSEDAIDKQKEKAKGRFSLPWFIERNGEELGLQKYEARNLALKNRNLNYSYPSGFKGTKRDFMTDDVKKKISDARRNLKEIEPEMKEAILSQMYTIKELMEKFQTSKPTILARKRLYLRTKNP